MAVSWNGNPWQPITAYDVRARVVNVGNVYICTVAGNSANIASSGPSGTGAAIADGSVTWAYVGPYTGCVLDVAPELASTLPEILPGAQAVYLAFAESRVADTDVWVDDVDDPVRYLAAHLGQLAQLNGHGPLTSESVGPLSASYGNLDGEFALQLTAAGRQYLDLVRSTTAIFGFTG